MKETLAKGYGVYDMTGNTGSRRYMAPEVAKELHYNASVDVYSFGILLWELCSAEKPFYGYGSGKHMNQVVLGGERPKMDSAHTAFWPSNLQWLMKKCWSASSSDRPTFTFVKQVLEDILQGKESIPRDVETVDVPEDRECSLPPKRSSMFRVSRAPRGITLGASPPAPGSFIGMVTADKPRRSRTWGFGTRR